MREDVYIKSVELAEEKFGCPILKYIDVKGKNTETDCDLSVRGQQMEGVESYKCLGLVVDNRVL